MPFASGESAAAAKINRLQTVLYKAVASGTLTCTTSEQDVSGAFVTFSTKAANAAFYVIANFDMFVQTVSGGIQILGRCAVDGVTIGAGGDAVFCGNFNNARASTAGIWSGTIAAAGSHTVKLRGLQDSAGGTYKIVSGSTSILVTVQEVV